MTIRRTIPKIGMLAALVMGWSDRAGADAISDALNKITGDSYLSREVLLSDLGFTQPMVMNGSDAAREIYLPVPAGIPLTDAFLQLDGKYLRADGGRTTVLLSLDGHPVAARSPTDERGVLRIGVGVDGAPRSSGFVRMDVGWSSYHARQTCDEKTIGNSYEIDDQSRLTFRYDGAAVRDLSTAWTALPASPVLLVASRKLSEDLRRRLAHRPGAASAGKRPVVQSLPAVGETVDLRGVTVPAALASLPTFAGLGSGGSYAAQPGRSGRPAAAADGRGTARRHDRRRGDAHPAQRRGRCAGRATPQQRSGGAGRLHRLAQPQLPAAAGRGRRRAARHHRQPTGHRHRAAGRRQARCCSTRCGARRQSCPPS